MNILQKRDVILAAAILLLAAAAFGISHYIRRTPAAIAQVSVDGAVVETLDLSKDTEITVTSSNGGTNHLIIQDGTAWISEASCPDKVCVHQGKVSLNGELIVCLPNRVIAKIVAPEP